MNEKPELKTWSDRRKQLNYKTDYEKQVITEMARVVNDIVRRRKELGLTQRDVAERTGITQAQVARLETSTSVPSMETVMKVALALGFKLGFEESTNEQAASKLTYE
ncbi:helix-turn-helix domain-containing protein [Paenibacillus terrae]|uniref:HTH cro/C1-type domain-containing protein n=1 Tax=Paenibacillus terrae TaxID=159743 RepID=A0A0D7X2H9_9BACL|nr:helix-turn-helix transcriptional regulator [Paenibacillus terrae]KJD45625.1 hypothetical protein QD47_10640 [Paenibacillus terrae]